MGLIRYFAGKIWFYKVEGMPALNGINVYRKTDASSRGVVFKAGPAEFKIRYSIRVKKWFVKFYWRKSHQSTYAV